MRLASKDLRAPGRGQDKDLRAPGRGLDFSVVLELKPGQEGARGQVWGSTSKRLSSKSKLLEGGSGSWQKNEQAGLSSLRDAVQGALLRRHHFGC